MEMGRRDRRRNVGREQEKEKRKQGVGRSVGNKK